MGPEELASLVSWLLAGHVISVILWIGGLFATYWMLRLHAHAPKDVHEKLTLMERSIALSTDIAATGAIGCGIAMLVLSPSLPLKQGWMHLKLAVVVIGLLPVHGMLRGKIKKFGQGMIKPIGNWMWSMVLASVTIIAILAVRKPVLFAKSSAAAPAAAAPTTPAK